MSHRSVMQLTKGITILLVLGYLIAPAHAATIPLGSFNFDSALFGNSLVESDGGVFRSSNWLNIVNADPGNPGALTGPNFNTGIANIFDATYTIGYGTGILNGSGNDLGIVAGFSVGGDTFNLSVSTDGSIFSAPLAFAGSGATDTGVPGSYFYGGGGPFSTNLFVIPVDLTAFGIAGGGSIVATRITGSPEADIFRVAGFTAATSAPVPEPASLVLLTSGLLGVGVREWRKRRTK